MASEKRVTDEQRAAWAEAAAKATPGPWERREDAITVSDVPIGTMYMASPCTDDECLANTEFVCIAREAVPALLAEHESQARELAELRGRAARVLGEVDNECECLCDCIPAYDHAELCEAVIKDALCLACRVQRALAPKEGRDDGK